MPARSKADLPPPPATKDQRKRAKPEPKSAHEVTADLRVRLRERYPLGKYATAEEVRNATGWARDLRSADFVAVACWPSMGEHYLGVEIKASRADFLNELRKPAKRQWLAEQVTETWFCAPPGIVKPEEVPDGVGLMEAWGGGLKLRAKVQARQYPDRKPGLEFWLSFCRSLSEREREATEQLEQFADWAGKPVSLKRLQELGRYVHTGRLKLEGLEEDGMPADPILRSSVERQVRRRREEARRKGEQWRTKWGNLHRRLWNAGAELGLVEPLIRWGDPPEDADQLEAVVRRLAAAPLPVKAAGKLREQAKALAELADRMDGTT